jgi:uncharacterized protein (TIGR03067 family)
MIMRTALSIATVAAVFFPAWTFGGEDPIAKERKFYQGTWKVTEFVIDGKAVGEDALKKLRFINKADGSWSVESDGKEISSGQSDIDPAKRPKTIDFLPTLGVFSGNEYLGIYELGKDTRQICFAPKDKGRPAEFASPAGSGQFLIKFERVKK